MANTIRTLSSGDITRKALEIVHNNLVFCKTINRQYDNRFAVTGAKNGGTLLIREPNEFTVRTGAVMDTQDLLETTQTMTVATQKGVDVNFTSAELTLSLDDFAERILMPACSRLAAEIDKDIVSGCMKQVYNTANTTHGTQPVLADILTARAKLAQGIAPLTNRYLLTDALAANSIITDSKSLYNSASEIARQYEQGLIGNIYGLKHFESEMTPTHTCGTRTTAGTANLATVTNGAATITTTHTNGQTFTVGDIITIAGVYEVNPETKVALTHLKQFVIATAYTGTGSGATMTFAWPIYKDGPKQNCYCADWTATTAATVVDEATVTASSGAASTTYVNNLAYHKDAFTMVTADLEMPTNVWGARKTIDNISMRIVRQYDIGNDKMPCRIDVLYGYKCIRPRWAVRVLS